MKSILLAVPSTFLLASCASTPKDQGPVPDPHRYRELTPGISTKDDAIATLGLPTSVSFVSEDGQVLQWHKLEGDQGITVVIRFGKDGRMIGIERLL
jgi:hypothetical protein